jgi:RNase P subunit RPR2
MTDAHYRLNVRCANCGWKGRVVIRQLLQVGQVKCTNCEVRSSLSRHRWPLLSRLWRSERSAFS